MAYQGIAPSLLLAMPQLDDPNFHRAVVLLCRHDAEGALGFVVNRPLESDASEVITFDPPLTPTGNLSVWEGGPVSQERGWVLCRKPPEGEDGLPICSGLVMSSSQGMLRKILEGEPAESEPERSRLFLGYAGWGPGQLDQELIDSAWLTVPLDLDLVFSTPPDELWTRAIRTLGIEPTSLAPGSGVH